MMKRLVAAHRHSLPLRAQGGHSLLARLGFLLATLCSRADTFGGHIFDPTWHEPSFSLFRRIFDILFFYSAPSPVTFPSRGLVTAVKTLFQGVDLRFVRPSIPPATHSPFKRHPSQLSPAASVAAMRLSAAADAADLITDSFICRLAAQRDLGIDQMPAD